MWKRVLFTKGQKLSQVRVINDPKYEKTKRLETKYRFFSLQTIVLLTDVEGP